MDVDWCTCRNHDVVSECLHQSFLDIIIICFRMLFIERMVTFGLFVEFGVVGVALSAVEVPKHLIIS